MSSPSLVELNVSGQVCEAKIFKREVENNEPLFNHLSLERGRSRVCHRS